MLRTLFSPRHRAAAVLAGLALCLVLTERDAERYGDSLQVALPLLAWGCAAANGQGPEFFLRYVVMFSSAHGSKAALGEAEVNRRPDGGGKGMPSAHTSTAVLGASSLVHDCVKGNPAVQAAAILSAGFVGGSRIEAGKHDIWQVLAGALLGYGCDRALRRPSVLRRRIAAGLAAAGAAARGGALRLLAAGGAALRRATAGLQGARVKTVSATGRPEPMLMPSILPATLAAAPSRARPASKAARSASATKASAQGAAATAPAAASPGRKRMARVVRKTSEGSRYPAETTSGSAQASKAARLRRAASDGQSGATRASPG